MSYHYKPKGVCSRNITFDIENGLVKNVDIIGGCSGNSQGIARLVEGMPAEEVIKRLLGVRCGTKSTSCPDQLAIAIQKATN